MYGPENAEGNGWNGFDARIEENAARSNGSLPELNT
jgi:hypothetical protein